MTDRATLPFSPKDSEQIVSLFDIFTRCNLYTYIYIYI